MKDKFVLLTIFIMLLAFTFTGCSPHIHLDFLGSDQIREVVLIESKSKTKEKILLIDLNGPIGIRQGPGILNREGDIVSHIYYRLKKASEDPLVRGIILRLDTPGGEGTASDIIYNEILRFKQETGIPVVALMMGVAASGGYYVACGCDFIMAHPTTVTGSIGVIAILPSYTKVLDKVGIKANVIKSGKMKDAGSPLKELTQDEREYFQDMLNTFYKHFLQVVYKNRNGKTPLSMEEIEEIADGRVYLAQKALKLKLIDGIGYFDDALKKTLSLARIRDANVIAYTYHPLRKTNVYANTTAQGNPFTVEIKAFENLLPSLKTGIYYLWLPSLINN